MRKSVCYVLIVFSFPITLFSQLSDAFRSPIDTTIKLAGNFAELRPNHFHGGLDIKTNNKEGMAIHAIGDGYVSKVRVSTYSYGKMLFITHPNGVVSVYAHLQSFNDTIRKYVKARQYKDQSYEIELKLKPGQIPVRKGDLIALSGNTGASEGPHLHLEIRDTSTEIAYNPLLFGFQIEDHMAPAVQSLMIYPADTAARISGINAIKKAKVVRSKGNYKVAESVVIAGPVYFGIEAYDSEDHSPNKNGVYSLEMNLDGKKIYGLKMDTLHFGDTRYVNTLTDYPEKLRSGKNIYRCYVSKNNNLKIYNNVNDRGIVCFSDEKVHEIEFILRDFSGNITKVVLQIKSKEHDCTKEKMDLSEKQINYFDCKKDNKFETSGFSINLPAGMLYEDVYSDYSVKDSSNSFFSSIHHVQNKNIPVHDYFDMAIKTKNVQARLESKLTIFAAVSGVRSIKDCHYENGFVKGKLRLFGDFKVVADTVPPIIKPINIKNNKNMSTQAEIRIVIDDKLSGIQTYSASIDNNWVLMEYDYKKKLLWYTFDESVTPDKHIFELKVTDERGNIASYKANFVR